MSEEARKFGAIGGKTRAANLTKKERSDAAKRAAIARWSADAETTDYIGVLDIGDVRISCAVLNDDARTRVLTQGDLLEALGRHRKASVRNVEGEEQTPPILQGEALKPYISKELREKSKPIIFRTQQGAVASGYRADILPDICAVYLKAYTDGALRPTQYGIAAQAGVLLHGLATVGIVAMVDQATGYQEVRPRDELTEILRRFISKELRPWARRFPFRFYERIFELKGWDAADLTPNSLKPREVGRITDDLIYKRLAPGIRTELRKLVPRDEKGRLVTKLHRHLTDEIGNPKLEKHIAVTMALMDVSPSWREFMSNMDRVLPRFGKNYELPLAEGRTPAAPRLPAATSG